jgi:DNA modification methylase
MQEIILGNNIEVLKNYPDNYFDSIVTDPPYGLGKEPDATELMKDWIEKGYHEVGGSGFMGKEWDAFVPQPIFWKEVFRVLKHGGHVVAFYGTRTYDWGVMAMRFAGFEVRDCIQWLYGSGFPKSHNISKAIDKMYGAEREVGELKFKGGTQLGVINDDSWKPKDVYESFSSTDQAKKWDGWGSALKPANEPIVLARKPLEKGLSIAENVLKWGTGAINIDGCRVGTNDNLNGGAYSENKKSDGEWGSMHNFVGKDYKQPQGRFPANLILTHHPECECVGTKKVKSGISSENGGGFGGGLYRKDSSDKIGGGYGEETIEDWKCHDDCPIKILDEQSGVSKSSGGNSGVLSNSVYGKYGTQKNNDGTGFGDKGGASRFFYVAKASKSERNKGLEGFEEKRPDERTKSGMGSFDEKGVGKQSNFHPTVKPIKLMQYLVRLITPPNGIVLDPFCGSGTTGIAAKIEGFNFVGIEMDDEYHKIAKARIENYTIQKEDSKQLKLF